ncbi:hypothetical protein [Agromyces sp. NPDC058104]|uniref:hypothetical protein n=1 Tax=Agromyces sp. NPDC058104 TaxID=3346342 RepID=UPI0036DF6E98
MLTDNGGIGRFEMRVRRLRDELPDAVMEAAVEIADFAQNTLEDQLVKAETRTGRKRRDNPESYYHPDDAGYRIAGRVRSGRMWQNARGIARRTEDGAEAVVGWAPEVVAANPYMSDQEHGDPEGRIPAAGTLAATYLRTAMHARTVLGQMAARLRGRG